MKRSRLYPSRNDYVPWKRVGKGIVLLNLIDGNYYVINDVGFKFWEMFDGKNDVNSISSRISKQYKINKLKRKKDIIKFANKLLSFDLVQISHFPIKEKTALNGKLIQRDFKKLYTTAQITFIGNLRYDCIELKYKRNLVTV